MSASMFMNFGILILTWIYITGCSTQNDTLEVAVVEDNLPANEEEDPAMPSKLNMTINLFQNDTNHVDLKLGMNTDLNEHRSIYVIRMNIAGQPVLRKQQIPIEGNIAFYQDKDAGANVMLTCDGFEVGHCDPVLEGSFYLKDVEYGLEPLSMDSPLRRKRSASGRRGKLYSVFRRKQDKPVKDDFQLNTESTNTRGSGQSMQLVDRVVDLSEFMSPASATMEMRRRISDTDTKPGQRKQRKRKNNSSSTPYQMGLIVIIDFSIYQTWYKRSDKSTAIEKDIDAKSKIRQYMAHVINGVDLRFRNLRSNRIKIVVSRYIIADTPGASPWTSRRFIAQPRDLVYADDALNELIKWRYRMGHELPKHDHTILFTGYDLYRPTLANKGVAGFARVRSMCSHSSVSVVEEHGGFGSILTATHEIGHSLGAYHDGHNNTCAGEDNFIMTPIGGSATPSNALNPFHFSECSEEAFDNLIEALPPNHCLTDETDIYDQEEFDGYLTGKAGQLYGPNEQCRQHLGSESYYAWGGILGEATEVCTHMACKNAMSNTSFNIYYAAQGTSCGNSKWCVDGECAYAEKAPKRDDTCVHGDAWRKFGGLTCAEYVTADPSRCYYSYYSRFCCVSCSSLRTDDPGCEYGNRKNKVCDMVDKDPRFCYHDNNENMCCGSCKKHNTGITGCEYGDRLSDCSLDRCADEAYSKKCCKTCSQFKPKPKLVAPALPLRESMSDTISVLPKTNSSQEGKFTSVPPVSNALSSFTLPALIPKSSISPQRKTQNTLLSTPHKIEGIKVSSQGPITPLKPHKGDAFKKPLVRQTKQWGFHHTRDWKSRQPIGSRNALLGQSIVVSNKNEGSLSLFQNNKTDSLNTFSTSRSDANGRLNNVFSQQPHHQLLLSNDLQPPVNDIKSTTIQQLEQEQVQKRKQQEREKQQRELQAQTQREYLQQQRLQREQRQKEQQQREQRQIEQQQREQRQIEQQQREQRQMEQQQREQRQREQQQREQRQREQQQREQREQRQREQQQREQRQREQQQREQQKQLEHQQQHQRQQQQKQQRLNRDGSTQFIVRPPPHQSTPPRIFHVNRFPTMSRSTNVLTKLRLNSIRPRTTTTTTTTTTAPPVVRMTSPRFFKHPPPEQCVKPGAIFMSLKCDWLVRLMRGLCKNPFLGRVCCEDCAPVQSREPVCVDDIGCSVERAAQCYNDVHRSQCCATCKTFKTEYQDCEYGDREKHCSLFLQYMPDYTCDAFRQSCCLSCKKRTETTTAPPLEIITTASWRNNVWDNSFNTIHPIPHNDRNTRFTENNNGLHWNK